LRSRILKACLLIVLVSLCVGLPIVKAEGDVAVSWTSPTTDELYSLFMVSADDGWAVGYHGRIIRWNGTTWNNVISHSVHSAEPALSSVFMVSADDGWAVGEHGKIIRWNGTSWNSVTSPTNHWLHSVFMVNADDGWAVGSGPGPGVIIHWDGSSWNNVTSPTTSWFYSVFMVSADDGWAVGGDGIFFGDDGWALPGPERVGRIIHWDGSSWNNVTSPTKSGLSSVFMVSADDGWAVGNQGSIIRWNGTSWNNVTNPVTYPLASVFMVDADDGWAVGNQVNGDGPGIIIRWDGTSWTNFTCPLTYWSGRLFSVFMVGADDGWAVGGWGTIQRWTGTEWIPEFSAAILMLVLISLTLVAVIVEKTALRKSRRPQLPSENQI
jgi:hypothetical protein